MSYRDALIDIISMAQHASPNVTGQMDDRRAHCTILSTVVVRTGISVSMLVFRNYSISPCFQSSVPLRQM